MSSVRPPQATAESLFQSVSGNSPSSFEFSTADMNELDVAPAPGSTSDSALGLLITSGVYSIAAMLADPFENASTLLRVQRIASPHAALGSSASESVPFPPSKLFASSPSSTASTASTASIAQLYGPQAIQNPPRLAGYWDAIRGLYNFPSEGRLFGGVFRSTSLSVVSAVAGLRLRKSIYEAIAGITDAENENVLIVPKEDLVGMSREEVERYIGELAAEKMRNANLIFTRATFSMTATFATTTFVLAPLRLIRTRLVCRHPAAPQLSVLQMVRDIYRAKGVRGFYPALPVSLLNAALETFLDESVDPFIFGVLRLDPRSSFGLVIMLQVSCALLSATAQYGLTTIERRLELQGAFEDHDGYKSAVVSNPKSIPYKGGWDCFSRICAEEGVSGLLRGFGLYASATVFFTAVTMFG